MQARRVVPPGGLAGFILWGSAKRLGLLPHFAKLLEPPPPSHADATLNQCETGHPGVAEQMLASVGPGVLAGPPASSGDHELLTDLPGPRLTRDATITLVSQGMDAAALDRFQLTARQVADGLHQGSRIDQVREDFVSASLPQLLR